MFRSGQSAIFLPAFYPQTALFTSTVSQATVIFAHRWLQQVCSVYGSEPVEQCLAYIAENLGKAQQQPAQTISEQKAAHNDSAAHTDTARFSCCSLVSEKAHMAQTHSEVSNTVRAVADICVVRGLMWSASFVVTVLRQ